MINCVIDNVTIVTKNSNFSYDPGQVKKWVSSESSNGTKIATIII